MKGGKFVSCGSWRDIGAGTYCHYFQLGSHDEQEAVVRMELQRRKEVLDKVYVCLCVMCAMSDHCTLASVSKSYTHTQT